MKKWIIGIAVSVVLLVSAAVFIPRLVHTCGDCGERVIGTGYRPNALFTQEDKVLCRDCAKDEHAFRIALGGSVEDYKRGLFE